MEDTHTWIQLNSYKLTLLACAGGAARARCQSDRPV